MNFVTTPTINRTPAKESIKPVSTKSIVAQDFELRESSKLGKMKMRQSTKTVHQQKYELHNLWNNRGDLVQARYFHPTPINNTTRTQTQTQHHFTWTEEQSKPTDRNASRVGATKKYIPEKSQQIKVEKKRVNNCLSMNSSNELMSLLQNQVSEPSSIHGCYPNASGKRHSGSSFNNIQKMSNQRETKLLAAASNRLERVKTAKGDMYKSDASAYFGFQSQVIEPKRKVFTTARNRGELMNQSQILIN